MQRAYTVMERVSAVDNSDQSYTDAGVHFSARVDTVSDSESEPMTNERKYRHIFFHK